MRAIAPVGRDHGVGAVSEGVLARAVGRRAGWPLPQSSQRPEAAAQIIMPSTTQATPEEVAWDLVKAEGGAVGILLAVAGLGPKPGVHIQHA